MKVLAHKFTSLLLLVLLSTFQLATHVTAQNGFSAFYESKQPFVLAIKNGEKIRPIASQVSGITVPHHLLAAQLMAHGFQLASAGHYDKIIILLPDHFKGTKTLFATSRKNFDTVLGMVPVDLQSVERLLWSNDLFETSDLFTREHGLRSLLPFVRHHFPGTEIVPIAISIRAKRPDWDHAFDIISKIVTKKTLVIQSTDFSHFLPQSRAVLRDQETLNALATGSLEEIVKLQEPWNLDSLGAQYLQTKLQREKFGAIPQVVANANSQKYFKDKIAETTSYVVQVYAAETQDRIWDTATGEGQVYAMAGDTLFGRHLTKYLGKSGTAEQLAKSVLQVTGGRPIILNLEGVMLEHVPQKLKFSAMTMERGLTLGWLKKLNVAAVSVANNHSNDLGKPAHSDMVASLKKSGIVVLEQNKIEDLGAFRIIGLTDLNSTGSKNRNLLDTSQLENISNGNNRAPLVAFMHWGHEGRNSPGQRELWISELLRQQAIGLIVGAHPHVASQQLVRIGGGETLLAYSLGNFLFDQVSDHVSGSLLEVRIFDQSTFFARSIALPRLLDSLWNSHKNFGPSENFLPTNSTKVR